MKHLKTVGIFSLIWLSLVFVAYALGYVVFNPGRMVRLAESGIRAEATVFAKEPLNHNLIRYSYTVGGDKFTGSGSAGCCIDNIQIGQSVVVYYDPNNPADSFNGDPRAEAENVKGLIFLIMIALPIIPMVVIVSAYLAVRNPR